MRRGKEARKERRLGALDRRRAEKERWANGEATDFSTFTTTQVLEKIDRCDEDIRNLEAKA